MTQTIHIHRVPTEAVPRAIRVPECARLLGRGLRAAGEVNSVQIAAELVTGYRQLWLVFASGNPPLLACWTTEIKHDPDGTKWVCLSSLAGTKMRLWAARVMDTMCEWAKREQCAAVRWAGRRGWGRAVPGARIIGAVNNDLMFERAAI